MWAPTGRPSLTEIRRRMLAGCDTLPVAAEYLHRTAFDTAAAYGKDMFLAIERLGTNRLPALLAVKARVDALAGVLGFGSACPDRLFHRIAQILPPHLPERLRAFRDRFEHHLIPDRAGDGGSAGLSSRRCFHRPRRLVRLHCGGSAQALLHRFVVAGQRSAPRPAPRRLSRTSSPSTSLFAATTATGSSSSTRRGRGGAGPQSVTGTSSATSSARTMPSQGPRRSRTIEAANARQLSRRSADDVPPGAATSGGVTGKGPAGQLYRTNDPRDRSSTRGSAARPCAGTGAGANRRTG